MVSNYFTFRSIVGDLNLLLYHQHIAELFSQEKDTLAVTFTGLRETLVISCRPANPLLYLNSRYTRAKANSADVCKACWNQVVSAASIHPSDRIVTLTLENATKLHAQLFGPHANVLLVDADGNILDTFKNTRKLIGTSYLPSAPLPGFDAGMLAAALDKSPDLPIATLLKTTLPTFGPALIAETLYRAEISQTTRPGQYTPEERSRLIGTLRSLLQELEHPLPTIYVNPIPRSAHSTGNSQHSHWRFGLIQLRHLTAASEERYDNVHHALQRFVSHREQESSLDQQKRQLLEPLLRRIEKAKKNIPAMQREISEDERAVQWERYGSLLMGHLTELARGMTAARVVEDGNTVEIPLDPALSPVQNAQHYFAKAKRSRRARGLVHKRLENEESLLNRAAAVVESLGSIDSNEGFKAYMNNHAQELDDLGVGTKAEARAALPFRIFRVDGGFEVLAGKSDTNNDLLTMKHAKPRDLWFHARGAGGSHVVLKIDSGRGEPSKRAKEEAAAVAAYYSKMRNAKLVPVAMTERKYVHKPKGAPAGTVVLDRESVIFARPSLPSSKQS